MSKQPSEGFLNMLIILLRSCNAQTGKPLIEYLEDFDPNVDNYDDKGLLKAVHEYKDKLYPPKEG